MAPRVLYPIGFARTSGYTGLLCFTLHWNSILRFFTRFNFLESMQDLSRSLTARNPKTKLHVIRGSPQKVLPIIFEEWGISHLVYEKDTSGCAAVRDRQIKSLASQLGIKVLKVLGHTLYEPEGVVKASGGNPTLYLSSWHSAVKALPPPPRPLPALERLPPPGDTAFHGAMRGAPRDTNRGTVDVDLNQADRISSVACFGELGSPQASTSIRGGETEALRWQLSVYCADTAHLACFAKPQTSPAEFDPPATMQTYMAAVVEPENLEGQLQFREMYYAAEAAEGTTFEGCTGFPWIDAVMRQLRQEGWIHHPARHLVAVNRVYGVKSFPIRFDKTGKLVRKFCPELAKFPDKYIYSPHRAPLKVQEEAECVIGKDYPPPILDERDEKEHCVIPMRAAFTLGCMAPTKK
ncbi:Cryptochrome/photolyase FAD-binding domain-containing protein [Pluteus cervinus]|uniref:Cryptochrome/photolyase FAD-binding domain-containing protein n=1 Tax=Pluteus cervinus TaxID=181527 RepID=A0ACD3B271_9AGAR|nr:Cryptochrome/photolyase FAD-binding domain-containing protein [Pluteus cervinus]